MCLQQLDHTCVVADDHVGAFLASTESKDAEIDPFKRCQWYAFDYRGRNDGEEKQDEGHEEENGERCCRSKHDRGRSTRSAGDGGLAVAAVTAAEFAGCAQSLSAGKTLTAGAVNMSLKL